MEFQGFWNEDKEDLEGVFELNLEELQAEI